MTDRAIPALGFVAPSGTGKTTLLRALLPCLRARGLRVGYLKHAHHRFDLDTPGKDSYELRAAGAEQTLIASRERWALQVEQGVKGEEPELAEMLARFDGGGLDLAVVEGFKHADFPKIEVHRAAVGQPPLYPNDPWIFAVATDGPLLPGASPHALPIDDPWAISDFILERLKSGELGGEDPRVALVRYYGWLRRYGCNDSHSGNASVRVGAGFYVTPTGAGADTLQPGGVVRCPLDGGLAPGASMDAPLHRAVYLAQPKARAILHSHGPYSVAASLSGQPFRPVDFEGAFYFDEVPVVEVGPTRHLDDSPVRVAEALAAHPVAMLRGHGVYAWGETLDQAYKRTCSLELSARTYLVARQAGIL